MTAVVLVGTVLVLAAGDASARGFSRTGSFGTRSFSINRMSPGNVTGMRSFQGFNGTGFTHNFSRSCSGGTCMSTGQTKTNSGQTWSHTGTATFNGNGSVSFNRTGIGPQGGTVSRSGSCTSGAGCSSTAKSKGPNGTSFTAQRTAHATGNGFIRHTATFTGPNGGMISHTYTTGGLW